MPEEIVYYVTRYGYFAIFILVFLQEIGMPNPIPNELLLIFSGYLSFKGLLSLPLIILTAVSADFIGTSILYFIFFKTGTFIIRNRPKWIPVSAGMIDKLTARISRGGLLSIFVFRLTPFTRGYTSVITGLLQVKPSVFLPIAFVSATTWAAFYVTAGHFIGPSWNIFIEKKNSFNYIMIGMLTLISIILFIFYLKREKGNPDIKKGLEFSKQSVNIQNRA